MAAADIRQYIRDRLLAFDPTIDLSDGSPADSLIVEPIARKLEPDPFSTDAEEFITTLLTQKYADLNLSEGSALRDLLVKPASLLLEPLRREIQFIRQSQSLANPELLSSADIDSLVANFFVSRLTGDYAIGWVRAYFSAPMAVGISAANLAYTASGLRFIPTRPQSISAESMMFNQEGGLYYMDIEYVAESTGSDYNIDAGEIVSISNLPNAVRVTNKSRFEFGHDEEDDETLISRTETSITDRSLVVPRGVAARLFGTFSGLKHLQVVGFSDAEMQRDVLAGGILGPVVLSGNDGYTEDDGDGDEGTYYLKSRYTNFLDVFGAPWKVSSYYLVSSCLHYGTDASISLADFSHVVVPSFSFENSDVGSALSLFGATNNANNVTGKIVAVLSEHEVKLSLGSAPFIGVPEEGIKWCMARHCQDIEIVSAAENELRLRDPLPVGVAQIEWAIRKKEITLSGIPGGIPDSASRQIAAVAPGEVHIGGCADFFVCGPAPDEASLDLPAISGESYKLRGTNLSTSIDYPQFVRVANADFPAAGIREGQTLVIETGGNSGSYNILRVGEKATPSVSFYYANETERLTDPGRVTEDIGKFAFQQDSGTYWKLTGVSPLSWSLLTVPGSAAEYLQISPSISSTEEGQSYKILDEIDINLVSPKTVRGKGDDARTVQLNSIVTTASLVDFMALGVEEGDIFEILGGQNKGKYTVISVGGVGNSILTLDTPMQATLDNQSWTVYKQYNGIQRPLVRVRSVELFDSNQQPTGYTIPYACPIDARTSAFSNAGVGTKLRVDDATVGIVGVTNLNSITFPLATCVLSISVNNGSYTNITLTGATSVGDVLNRINAVFPRIAATIERDDALFLTLRSSTRWIKLAPGATNAVLGLSADGDDNRRIRSASVYDWTSSQYGITPKLDVVTMLSGDSCGKYYIVKVDAGYLTAVGFDEDKGQVTFPQPGVEISVEVGSRSYGKARLYFLEPTTFQVLGRWRPALRSTAVFPSNAAVEDTIYDGEEPTSYFTVQVGNSTLRFFPDPQMERVLQLGTKQTLNNLTTDGSTVAKSDNSPPGDLGKTSRDASADFLEIGIRTGDILKVTYIPIQGTADILSLSLPSALAGKTLKFSVNNGPMKTMTFTDQITQPDDVADAINTAYGATFAYIESISGHSYLRLEADFELRLFGTGTANVVLGLPTDDMNNRAPAYGQHYIVQRVSPEYDLTLRKALVLSEPLDFGQAQHFSIVRFGVQYIHASDMKKQTEDGLYYMDVELVSDGSGDQWNLEAGQQMSVQNYHSDGYHLEVEDANLSFSTEEQVKLVIQPRVSLAGGSPGEPLIVYGQNVSINYDWSSLVTSIQNFVRSELERVLTASILVRHLQPHYLFVTIEYQGGSQESVVEEDVLSYLNGLSPNDRVEASDLQNLALRRGANYVKNPLQLIAVVHNLDRTITVDRSTNYVSKGRLSTFLPDRIVIVRNVPSAL